MFQEEIVLPKGYRLGEVEQLVKENNVRSVKDETDEMVKSELEKSINFEEYLHVKLKHLGKCDFDILSDVLRKTEIILSRR